MDKRVLPFLVGFVFGSYGQLLFHALYILGIIASGIIGFEIGRIH